MELPITHLTKRRTKGGQTLLVLGAGGGLGITAIHVAKAMGAKVIAAASSEDKLELCKEKVLILVSSIKETWIENLKEILR
ncbi:MAG: hypothetical protein Ct9H90mP4_08530 [Gammaproteobacteria bacterium]|nr:MAG: hypothetical protein Ct9H90mP4_08530 [Gammaproteobacteria bacterium]